MKDQGKSKKKKPTKIWPYMYRVYMVGYVYNFTVYVYEYIFL